jgi:phage tail protein X
MAVAQAAAAKSSGLDGLSYKFYAAIIDSVGPSLLEAVNSMLAAGQITASLRRVVVCLLPKMAGVPTVAQLRHPPHQDD